MFDEAPGILKREGAKTARTREANAD